MSMSDGPVTSKSIPQDAAARYKYQRLRDRLRQAVQSGELGGKLPGERELARRYDANAKTINKALCDLTTEGLLIRHVGRGTFVADGSGPSGSSRRKLMTYAWISAGTSDALEDATIHRATEAMVRQRGHRLVSLLAPGDQLEISESLVTPGQLRSWDGVILAHRTSDRLIADLHRRHLPTVMASNTHERIRTSAVLPDYAQGAFELTQFLVHLGHHQIRLLISPRLVPAASVADAGYRAALLRNGLHPADYFIADERFDWLGLMRQETRPSALICIGAEVAVRACAEAKSAGLELPSMLSLCAVPGAGRSLVEASITSYDVSTDDIARWVLELLLTASPGQLPRTIIVPGELVDRGSAVAPVAGSGAPTRPEAVEL